MRRALIDDELRASCKYWKVPFREPEGKKEKADAATARQALMRQDIKVAETEYYKNLNGMYADVQNWFYHRPAPTT